MHKLIEYVCDELDELERKAGKDGKLSMSEIQYADTLAHMKKNLMKADEMSGEYSGYSNDQSMRGGRSYRNYSRNSYNDGGSYEGSYARDNRGRGSDAQRDAMGRYSGDGYSRADDFAQNMRMLMEDAPNDHVRKKLQSIMSEM